MIQPAPTLAPAGGLSRPSSLHVVAVAVAALSLLSAPLAQTSPLPPLLVYLLSLVITLGTLRALVRGDERRFVVNLFLGAFVLRVVLVAASHLALVRLGMGGFVFPDDRAYDKLGWDIARAWRGEIPGILQADSYLLMNYTYLLGSLYYHLGHSVLAAKVLDALFGALTAVGTYALARTLWDERPARVAGIAAALFPSLLFWSLLNLKDTLVVMLVAFSFFGMLHFARANDWRGALLALLSLALIENMRGQLFIIIGWLLPLGYFAASRLPLRPRLTHGLPFTVLVFATVYLLGSNTLGLEFLSPREVKSFEALRSSDEGDVATRLEMPVIDDENVYRRQLKFLPLGLFNVIFAPLPWAVSSPRELAVQPDMAAWHLALLCSLVGLARALRTRHWAVLAPAAYVGGLMAAMALVESNVGTLVRHRAMLLPPLIAIAAPGLWLVWSWLVARLVRRPPTLQPTPHAVPASER